MQYFTVQAASPREALEKMRLQYGAEARILTHKSIRRGGFLGLFAQEGVEITGYIPTSGRKSLYRPAAPSSSGPSTLQSKQAHEESKKKILAEVRKEQALQQILREIRGLKEHIGTASDRDSLPQGMQKIEQLLIRNDFTRHFVQKILSRIRNEFSLEALEDAPALEGRVLGWIGEGIRVYPTSKIFRQERKVFIVVGPTGVGKTTTIAKLAAIYGLGNSRHSPLKVKIVSIDNYRIAARHQIETYAEIMNIPAACVESAAEFQKVLALSEGVDLVLVDTIGKSPQDLSRLAEMKEVLDAAGSLSETHLVLSATTKASDVEDILKQFEPFRYQAVILTKLDETMRIGNIISILARADKPVSYIADGQGVPQDIEEASVIRLLMSLDGFHIDRDRIERQFGKREKINDKYWS